MTTGYICEVFRNLDNGYVSEEGFLVSVDKTQMIEFQCALKSSGEDLSFDEIGECVLVKKKVRSLTKTCYKSVWLDLCEIYDYVVEVSE